jgi:hypothetical protein
MESGMDDAILRRCSVGDPDYDPEYGVGIIIRVDGVEQINVIGYDIDAGAVLRYATGDDGLIRLNQDRTDALRETVTGVVTVERR